MKRFHLKILITLALFPSLSKSQGPLVFTAIDPVTDITQMKDVFFLDDNTGWILGWGSSLSSVAKTTDGGSTWTQVYPGGYYFDEIYFTTDLDGYGVGDCWAGVYCAQTSDAGATWNLGTPLPGVSSFIWHVEFFDQNAGWIGGQNESYRTTDGGTTWAPMSLSYITETNFISPLVGWAGSYGYLYSTVDGGVNWNYIPTPCYVHTIDAFDSNSILIGCSDGSIYTSDDGGSTWNLKTTGPSQILDVQFEGALGVAVGSSGYTKVSYDYGQTWIDNSFTTNELSSVYITPNGVVFITAGDSNIYRSNMVNDLLIDAYIDLDTLCADVLSDVNITIKNLGPNNINAATIVLSEGVNDLLTFNWTGNLALGQSETLSLGSISLYNSGYYNYFISGDTITSNNSTSKYIFVDTTVHAGPDQLICPGDEVEITAEGGNEYHWFGLSGDTTSQTQLVSSDVAAYYPVLIKNNYCTKVDSVFVDIKVCSDVFTAFSPNGDGVNDFLELDNIPTGDNILKVYNRWGDLINSFTNYDNNTVQWDGTDSKGEALNEGTYYYVFQSSDNSVSYSSWIQIVR